MGFFTIRFLTTWTGKALWRHLWLKMSPIISPKKLQKWEIFRSSQWKLGFSILTRYFSKSWHTRVKNKLFIYMKISIFYNYNVFFHVFYIFCIFGLKTNGWIENFPECLTSFPTLCLHRTNRNSAVIVATSWSGLVRRETNLLRGLEPFSGLFWTQNTGWNKKNVWTFSSNKSHDYVREYLNICSCESKNGLLRT